MSTAFELLIGCNGHYPSYKAMLIILILLPWTIPIVGAVPRFRSSPSDGSKVVWRNSSWMYGVVWFTLLILINIATVLTLRRATIPQLAIYSVLLTGVIVFAVLWMVLYHTRTKQSGIDMFILLLLTLSVLLPFTLNIDNLAGSLFVPLLVWASFQLAVNVEEVKISKV